MRVIAFICLLVITVTLPWRNAGAESFTIAILPIQNEGDPYYQLSDNPASDLTRLMDMAKERMRKPVINRDAHHADNIRNGLTFHLGRRLALNGYKVFMGKDYDEFYKELERRGREITYEKLQTYVPADAFLLVQIQQWDSAEFETAGKLTIAYTVTLIDPKRTEDKGIAWTNSAKKTIELEPNDFLYRNRYEDLIREAAVLMLKGFPKTAR